MNALRSVRIEWEGPLSIEEILRLHDQNDDYGLYQIYGPHKEAENKIITVILTQWQL